MKNKKAWIRIAEASIAILIIITSVFIITLRQSTAADISKEIYEKQSRILNIIVENNTLRQDILNTPSDLTNINQEISKLIPNNWDFAVKVCDLNQVCPNPQPVYDRNTYTAERIVSSTLTTYNPKKIRFFVWMK